MTHLLHNTAWDSASDPHYFQGVVHSGRLMGGLVHGGLCPHTDNRSDLQIHAAEFGRSFGDRAAFHQPIFCHLDNAPSLKSNTKLAIVRQTQSGAIQILQGVALPMGDRQQAHMRAMGGHAIIKHNSEHTTTFCCGLRALEPRSARCKTDIEHCVRNLHLLIRPMQWKLNTTDQMPSAQAVVLCSRTSSVLVCKCRLIRRSSSADALLRKYPGKTVSWQQLGIIEDFGEIPFD